MPCCLACDTQTIEQVRSFSAAVEVFVFAWIRHRPSRRLGARPRIRRGRAHGAYEASSRREEAAMSVHIVDDEHRGDRPQSPCARRVPATQGHLRRWRSSTRYRDIACAAPPCICPRGARNAAPPNSRTGSWRLIRKGRFLRMTTLKTKDFWAVKSRKRGFPDESLAQLT
jgi:hypothetical protein